MWPTLPLDSGHRLNTNTQSIGLAFNSGRNWRLRVFRGSAISDAFLGAELLRRIRQFRRHYVRRGGSHLFFPGPFLFFPGLSLFFSCSSFQVRLCSFQVHLCVLFRSLLLLSKSVLRLLPFLHLELVLSRSVFVLFSGLYSFFTGLSFAFFRSDVSNLFLSGLLLFFFLGLSGSFLIFFQGLSIAFFHSGRSRSAFVLSRSSFVPFRSLPVLLSFFPGLACSS